MRASFAIDYYRKNPRVIDTLQIARCFDKKAACDPARLERFLNDSTELHALETRIARFNLFETLGVATKEIRHSRFLCWLFDPRASHAQGDRYLRAFLKLVCDGSRNVRLNPQQNLSTIEILCERDGIDLRIVDPTGRFVCAIEHKLYSQESEGQLADYRHRIATLYPRFEQVFVFLTLNGEPASDPHYRSIDYAMFLQRVLNADESRPDSTARARALLFAHYAATIRSRAAESEGINVLDLLHLGRTELKHSDFIARLLRPNGSHGLGDKFSHFVLRLLEEKGARLPKNADTFNLEDLIVSPEHEDIDIFAVSESNRLVIAIENKLRAREHGQQLASRYDFVRRHYGGDHTVFVFLDLKGNKPSHPGYLPISHEDFLPFFDEHALEAKSLAAHEQVTILCDQHFHLLADHLRIKKGQTWSLSPGIQSLAEKIAGRYAGEGNILLSMIKDWQRSLGKELEPFLYELADRFFGPCKVKDTQKVWFRFIPAALDNFDALRCGGADDALRNRLMYYEFFVNPFGDNVSVRKAGISIDVKLANAKPEYAEIKKRLHSKALENPIFNRVTKRISGNSPLVNYQLCSFEEALTCERSALRQRIEHRVERFAGSFHHEIIALSKVVLPDHLQ